ncbi:hypothetical protein AURDEDRAFT_184840, partial [Auricularia subglabra TFB-10046 SS5]
MAQSVAVLGGGISGLSAAFHLLRKFPKAHVTLFDGAPMLGGWLAHTSGVVLRDSNARLVFEIGPVTLRPRKALWELIVALGIAPAVMRVQRDLPQFAHIPLPRYPGLTPVPVIQGNMRTFTSRLFFDIMRRSFKAAGKGAHVPKADEDESLEQFLVRTFDPELGRVGASAVAHAVYAADSRSLSARAALGRIYEAGSLHDFIVQNLFDPAPLTPSINLLTATDARGRSCIAPLHPFCLSPSTGLLPIALMGSMRADPRFTYRKEYVSQLRGTTVVTEAGASASFTRVVSALPLYTLRAILAPEVLEKQRDIALFLQTPYASVTIVHLIFSADGCPLPRGLGYINARAEPDAPTPRVLSVVFDSCIAPEETGADAKFTRCTAALSEPVALDELLREIGQHVGATMPEPLYANAFQADRCIPTPPVGHLTRLRDFRTAIDREWKGELEVIGAAVASTPRVDDCVELAGNVGQGWAGAL